MILKPFVHSSSVYRIIIEQKKIYTHIPLRAGLRSSVADKYIDTRHAEKATVACKDEETNLHPLKLRSNSKLRNLQMSI